LCNPKYPDEIKSLFESGECKKSIHIFLFLFETWRKKLEASFKPVQWLKERFEKLWPVFDKSTSAENFRGKFPPEKSNKHKFIFALGTLILIFPVFKSLMRPLMQTPIRPNLVLSVNFDQNGCKNRLPLVLVRNRVQFF
jgi:hypothetical protein